MPRPYATGYSREFRQAHEAQLAQEAREQAERDAANARVRAEYLARIDAERDAKRQEGEAARDAALEPTRVYELHRWLADHPGQSEATFNRDAWPHIKANLTSREALIEREKAALRASGRY